MTGQTDRTWLALLKTANTPGAFQSHNWPAPEPLIAQVQTWNFQFNKYFLSAYSVPGIIDRDSVNGIAQCRILTCKAGSDMQKMGVNTRSFYGLQRRHPNLVLLYWRMGVKRHTGQSQLHCFRTKCWDLNWKTKHDHTEMSGQTMSTVWRKEHFSWGLYGNRELSPAVFLYHQSHREGLGTILSAGRQSSQEFVDFTAHFHSGSWLKLILQKVFSVKFPGGLMFSSFSIVIILSSIAPLGLKSESHASFSLIFLCASGLWCLAVLMPD